MSRPYANESPFHAVSHPIRRRILDLLRQRDRNVQDIAGHFRASLATVSQHLRVLRTAGLVAQRREKTQRIFTIHAPKLASIVEWLKPYESAATGARVSVRSKGE